MDDRPYGGGPGMVMMAEPLEAAIEAAKARQREAGVASPKVVLMSPQGERLTEALVRELAAEPGLVIVAGRYEGVDERLVEKDVDREVSIGDYVTSGGELPAMVVIDCIVRRLPGSLHDAQSASQDSFGAGLLDWPHYTRPEEWKGERVPGGAALGGPREDRALAPDAGAGAHLGAPAGARRRAPDGARGPAVARGVPPGQRQQTARNRRAGSARNGREGRKAKGPAMNLIQKLEQEEIDRLGRKIPVFAPGDTVIVNVNGRRGRQASACRPTKAW